MENNSMNRKNIKKNHTLFDEENIREDDVIDVKLMEEKKERQLNGLRDDVKVFKTTVGEINNEIKRSIELLTDVNSQMNNTQSGLGMSLDKIKNLAKEATTTHMCYLILFCVGVFFLLFYFFRK